MVLPADFSVANSERTTTKHRTPGYSGTDSSDAIPGTDSRLSARTTNRSLLVIFVISMSVILAVGFSVDMFTLLNLIIYVVLATLALSLALVWGYGGILCFGQAAFYGLGAYTYAVAALNFGESTGALLLAVSIAGGFAAILGGFMFYGRLSDVYLGVITLAVTLILFKLVNSTAGDQYVIGSARLGGFNGIHGVPSLNLPGDPSTVLLPNTLFIVCASLLLIVYLAIRMLLTSHFGKVIVAIRENEQRAEMLGYDVRWYKTALFAIGGAIAGLAGAMFVNWGGYADPSLFSLFQSAQIIIWVIVGGLGSLFGPMLGAVSLYWLTAQLGTQSLINNNLVLGAILVLFVLLIPRGLLPTIRLWASSTSKRNTRTTSRLRGTPKRSTK